MSSTLAIARTQVVPAGAYAGAPVADLPTVALPAVQCFPAMNTLDADQGISAPCD